MSNKKFKKNSNGENAVKVSGVSKRIKNDMSSIRDVENITAKQKLKLRCKCQHIDENGKTMLFRSENQKSDITGNPLFVCRLCGSYLDIYEVTEEEVAAKLKEMQEKNARVEVKEGAIENGNIAVIDFKGFIDGVAFEGGEGHDYSLEIGSGSFIDNFEEQLVGAKAGDKVEVNVTFPENYGKEELNGKPAKFEVEVKEVKAKELPVLDDEFAKEVSEFETLEALKEDTTKKLEEANTARAEREYEEAILRAVVENAKMDIPAVMVEQEIDRMVQNLAQRLQYQGLTLEQYFQFTGTDAEKMREYMKENAETKVKTELVLEALQKAEKMEVLDEELKEKASEVAKLYGANDEKMVELLLQNQREALVADVMTSKVINFLKENN